MPASEGVSDGTRGADRFYLKPWGFKTLQAVHMFWYRLTGGVVGHRFGGLTMLLLTYKGAKTGKAYTTPLNYGRDGDNLVLVASKGGVASHPFWYRGLVANPDVEAQAGQERGSFHARTASGAERARLWQLMVDGYGGYEGYQQATDREIPVVVLEPVEHRRPRR
jgi:deazaflavin-dependent oxidoreductase (nitroreductase family)